MPSGSIRVGGARVDFSVQDAQYQAGMRRILGSNARLDTSIIGLGRSHSRQSKLVQQFTSSLRASIIATAAYAAGINLLRAATFGSVQVFLEWDKGLIRVAKTTGLADDELARLETRLQNILTGVSRTGAPLPISEAELLDIAEAAGQIGVRGVPALDRLIQSSAALAVSSNISGRDAAITLGRLIRLTGEGEAAIESYASAITGLGNEIAGNEDEIAKFVQGIAAAVGGTGGLSPDVLFALSAAFVETGANAESASTVVGRVTDSINTLAGRNVELFNEIGRISGRSVEEVTRLREALRGGDERAYAEALNLVVTALANLNNVGGETQLTRSDLLEAIFGETNVRTRRETARISESLERFGELIGITGDFLENQGEQFREAARAGEAYDAIIGAVGNKIREQRRAFGEFVITSIFGDETDSQSQLRAIERFQQIQIHAATVTAAVLANLAVRTARTRYNAYNDEAIRTIRARQLVAAEATRNANIANAEVAALRQRGMLTTTLDIQAATAKNNLNVLRKQEIALESRLVAETRLRTAEELRLGQASLLTRTLEQRARRDFVLARIERGRATNAIARAGTAQIELAHRTAIAQTNAIALTRVQTFAQGQLNVITRIGTRVVRGYHAAIAFLGGGLGVLTLALVAGTTAWSLWGKAAVDATDGLDTIEDRLQNIITSASNLAQGITPDAIAVREGERQLFLLNFELQRLRAEEERVLEVTQRLERQGFGQIGGAQLAGARAEYQGIVSDIQRVQKELDTLSTLIIDADTVVAASAAKRKEELEDIPGLVEIDLRITDPTREISKFISQIQRETSTAFAQLALEIQTVTTSPFEQEAALRIFERRIQNSEKLAELERIVANALEDQTKAVTNEGRATAESMRFDIATKAREAADEQLESAVSAREETDRAVFSARAALRFALEKLDVDEQAIRALLRQENTLENLQVIYGELAKSVPDVFGQTEAAQETFQAIVDSVMALEQEAETLQRLTGLRDRDRAVLEEQIQLQERFAQATQQAERIVEAAVRARRNAVEQYVKALMELGPESSDEQRAFVRGLLEATVETDRAASEAEIYRIELERLGVSLDELTTKAGEAAGTIFDLSQSAVDYLLLATELAQSGIRNVEDAIVGVLGSAEFSFRQFAGALIEDLGRIIIRATITANILRALGIGAGGELTGGGLFGALGLGAAPAAHSGGVADYLTQRRSGPLRANERFIVVEKDEEIITRGDPRHRFNLPRYHSGGLGGRGADAPILGEVDIMVALENRSSTPLRATQTTQRVDGRRHIVGVVLEDLRDNGPIAQALSSGGGF